MSHKRLFPDDQRERLRREAMELASALIAQIVLVLQMPEPPGAAALRTMMRGALAHGEAIARRVVWMLAACLAARRPQVPVPAPRVANPRPAAPSIDAAPRPAKPATTREHTFRLTEPYPAPKAAAKPALRPTRALAARQKLIDTS